MSPLIPLEITHSVLKKSVCVVEGGGGRGTCTTPTLNPSLSLFTASCHYISHMLAIFGNTHVVPVIGFAKKKAIRYHDIGKI